MENLRGRVLGGQDILCGRGIFVVVVGAAVAEAGTGVTEAGTGGVGVVVIDVVVPLETASFRPRVEVSCVVGKSSVWLRGRKEEPSIKGVPNFPRGGFIGKCGEVIGDFLGVAILVILVVWIVERWCLGLLMKSLGNRCRRTRSGWR